MPQEIAIPGTHKFVVGELEKEIDFKNHGSILDVGAGHGALSLKLKEAGLTVSACDVVPEQFEVNDVEFKALDPTTGILPYNDETFDAAVAVEVVEHIDGHSRFFAETSRVLKPEGFLMFTTPNILSLKSRLRFLFTGWFYSFGPLTPFETDPVHQHISGFSINRYAWMLSQHGMTISRITTDKIQSSSCGLCWLVPFIWLGTLLQGKSATLAQQQNCKPALFGRKLVIIARKSGQRSE